ncbi:unnamed protein product [Tetraodon nigroviridis]|uniref:(spotted green pufferfish) hypothetical protein n=1 Tax=Tetraodon nigroviridis TaxID=99883 RepID=Q4S5T9_TETNG|nr:unnamed protein product [Tetraodon nigroviridis]
MSAGVNSQAAAIYIGSLAPPGIMGQLYENSTLERRAEERRVEEKVGQVQTPMRERSASPLCFDGLHQQKEASKPAEHHLHMHSQYCLPILQLPTEGRLASQGPEHDRMTTLLKGMMGNKWKWQRCGSQLSLSPLFNKCQPMKMDRSQALICVCSRSEPYPSYALHCPTYLISSGDGAEPGWPAPIDAYISSPNERQNGDGRINGSVLNFPQPPSSNQII